MYLDTQLAATRAITGTKEDEAIVLITFGIHDPYSIFCVCLSF